MSYVKVRARTTQDGPAKRLTPAPTKADTYGLFARLCSAHGIPSPAAEYRFHPTRKWRFDFAWPHFKVALEIDGAIWTRGAHGRGSGIARDQEKGNAACALGWRVLRVEPKNYAVASTFQLIKQTLSVGIR